MNITHDIIAAVAGPGWKYGLSRILIDDEKNGVVFIAGSQEPFASFTADMISTSKGTGTTADGALSWRRRGCRIGCWRPRRRWTGTDAADNEADQDARHRVA